MRRPSPYVPLLWALTTVGVGLSTVVAFARPSSKAEPRATVLELPAYDTKTEEIFTGMVTDVSREDAPRGQRDIYAVVNTAAGPITVHIGPERAVEGLGLELEPGDEIELVGSKTKIEERALVLAREIMRDGTTFILRDAAGKPVWAKSPSSKPGV